ncbi:MAG: sugar phosphate isomerase/epimerase family protein [Planctomycetaceae bacterium]
MSMKLSLSVRIAEAPCKTKLNVPLGEIVQLAKELGYQAICMRASAGGVQTPRAELENMRRQIESAGLTVSMVTADFDVPLNNDDGPNSLRNISPSLDVAEALGCDLIRICLKTQEDLSYLLPAVEQAANRGIRLAHQCHHASLFERVDDALKILESIGHDHFGLTYEPANLYVCGEDYGLDVIRQFQPYLMNVYLQNHRLAADGAGTMESWTRGVQRFDHLPIWESGGVDFPKVVDALKAIDYDGFVTIHQAYGEIMGPREAAVESARYLRSLGGFTPHGEGR